MRILRRSWFFAEPRLGSAGHDDHAEHDAGDQPARKSPDQVSRTVTLAVNSGTRVSQRAHGGSYSDKLADHE